MIFLGGIHGVGKTSLLALVKQEYNISVFSASDLIANKKDFEYVQNKNRTDIAGDQDILVQVIKDSIAERNYILDGHFCLLNSKGEVNRVPKQIFLELPIKKIFVLKAEISEIIQRLSKRDNKNYSYEEIRLFQESEIEYAEEIAYEKNIGLEVILNKDKLLDYLRRIKK